MNSIYSKLYSLCSLFITGIIVCGCLVCCKKTENDPPPAPIIPVTISAISPDKGPFSTVVTITGSGFNTSAASDTVKFNGINAVVQQATATQLTVVVPKSAGTGAVTVRVANQSATGPVFNYDFTVTVSTFAGSGGGFINGTGVAAQFSNPFGVATDELNNVYISEFGNNVIRKITPSAVVSTLSGNGAQGFADGTGTAAKFNFPSGEAVDAQGNIYVADQSNHRIRKITAAGDVSTFAGNGVTGLVNGQANLAQFFNPTGVAIDPQGNILVADAGNNCIRKITTAGVVSTFAGTNAGFLDGNANTAQFHDPTGIVTDAQGNVYVADHVNHRIRKISVSGIVSTLAGSGVAGFADGTGTAAQFNFPVGLTKDVLGNILVADGNNYRIRKITPAGVVSTLAGSGIRGNADGDGAVAQFLFPYGVASDSKGNIYVTDFSNHRIRVITVQ